MKQFFRGIRAGIPIGIGYLSVAFTFGIMAVSYGFTWWQALVISMTTLTSAGQLAAIGVMGVPGQYVELLISQLTINLRYSFMSVSLSQKAAPTLRGWKRWLLGFFISDEIFAVAAAEDEVRTPFLAGLAVAPYLGWSLGTLVGGLLGNVLPPLLMNALCLAIYGMFLAIVLPPARASRPVLVVVLVAVGLHTAFYHLPLLRAVPSGIAISICAVVAALVGAFAFPIGQGEEATE